MKRQRAKRLPFGPKARVTVVLPARSKAVREPSGIAFHPSRGTLYVVGDRGDVAELSREGEVLRQERLKGRGFEGVTVGPRGRIFAIEERRTPRIYELDPDTLEIQAKYEVDPRRHGKRVLGKASNKRTEGLCYLPEQDAFYCVNQDPPRLVRLEVPVGKKQGTALVVDVIDLSKVVERHASDITHDPVSGHLLVVESSRGKGKGRVYELTPEGAQVSVSVIPGKRAEGLALDGTGSAFIADDAGGVLRLDP
jgi:uncharacterized protein YjiK